MRAGNWIATAIGVVVLSTQAGESLDKAALDKLKAATVFMKVVGPEGEGQGSGFFVDTKLIVTNDPCMRHQWTDSLEQTVSNLPTCLELDFDRHIRLVSPNLVIGPDLWKVQFPIEERAPSWG